MVGVSKGLPKRLAVLDVAGVVVDPRIEDIVKRVSSEEQVADDPHTLSEDFMGP